MPQKIKKIVFCAAGTGGHFFPAFNYANLLKKKYSVVFIINREEFKKILIKEGIKFYTIKIKYFRLFPLKDFLKTLLLFLFNFWESLIILLKERPSFVFCFGNFSSFWIGILSKVFLKRLIIHEQNVNYGKVNKILGFFADKICVQKWTKSIFKNKEVFLPLILRKSPKDLYKKEFVVLFFGGSQGSRIINNLFLKIYKDLLKFNMKLILITGKDNFEMVSKKIELCDNLEIYDFFEEMHKIYSKTKVCVMRAGIMSIFEVLSFKIYPLLLPHYLAQLHQVKNALYFHKIGLAYLCKEDPTEIKKRILSIYKDKTSLEKFRKKVDDFLSEYNKEVFLKNFELITKEC